MEDEGQRLKRENKDLQEYSEKLADGWTGRRVYNELGNVIYDPITVQEKLDKAIVCIKYFIERVEAGTIRSEKTYKMFKDTLKEIENK